MTRTLFRRRPEVERSESVQLLSVAGGLAQHAVKAPANPRGREPRSDPAHRHHHWRSQR